MSPFWAYVIGVLVGFGSGLYFGLIVIPLWRKAWTTFHML